MSKVVYQPEERGRVPWSCQLPVYRTENHSLFPADLENFARVAYEVVIVVVLSVEKQIFDIYFACVVERSVQNIHAHNLLDEVW